MFSAFWPSSNLPPQTKLGVLPFDPWVLGCAIALVLTGFVMISSASLDVAMENNGTPYYYVIRQASFMLIALLGAVIVWNFPISFWERSGHWWMLAAGFLLILVLIPGIGKGVNGSHRWLPLGPLNLQASEVAKFCMVMYMGGYLVRRLHEVRSSWKGIAKPTLPLGIFCVLLYFEPDFGALVVLMGTVMGMIFLGGMRFSQFLVVIVSVVGLLGAVVGLQPYRVARLQSFLDPWQDPFGTGYQLSQAQIAFGRGEWFGTGLGNSVQKLFYLPEAHTDFVFSVLAEELGFVGAAALIVLYAILVVNIFRIGRRAEKMKAFFKAYICYGFGIIFAGQALINIGVNVGALPTKGLTLPLVSYGGSSLLVSCAMLAVILRVDYELKKSQFSPSAADGDSKLNKTGKSSGKRTQSRSKPEAQV
ncbi:putative lipid II flippase FtsW [Neptuniibacter sp. 1_MG-2023]|uniref:putative lipid II flippase FtsW n=1 Tax=Neptuniibacter sp. 1_MG-2023 TaxID=3062662 RepID=UPI0026E38B84|nr:putative lipid II flippase FtsW [Neptuniibacter sp. 1_MG-2023]MDO6592971.1 putative lipid II flippase FtsW [Neptuniibacter sp. 1_MG-2023]